MKQYFILTFIFVIGALTLNAQLSLTRVHTRAEYTKDKKMHYDGSSKFLFFYQDSVKIFPRWTEKESIQLQREKDDVDYSNEKRLEYLEEFFPYPFEIGYPSYSNVNLDTKGCRYLIVVNYSNGGASSTPAFSGTSLSGSPALSGTANSPTFVIIVFDIETKTRKKIKTLVNWFDFDELVKAVETKFID